MNDAQWMQLALEEGQKGRSLTSPNPAVGAVIIKEGKLLGKGWHQKAGQPHAEREAIADALSRHNAEELKGSTIYVTLEPCSTHGRTPPCAQGIIDHGISRVVYGAVDPNPEHAGAADAMLHSHGIEVTSGVEKEACEKLLRPFAKRITTGLPWVIAKTAMSLDGRITRPSHEGQWLTGPEARAEVHRIRAEVDAIIVGGQTVRRDNPRLTLRGNDIPEHKEQPWRVVLTKQGKGSLPADADLFTDAHKDRTLVFENHELETTLRQLAERGCNAVMLECGGRLLGQFTEAGLIDEVALFYAPILTGGPDLGFSNTLHLPHSQTLREVTHTPIGPDLLIRAIVEQ